MEYHYYVYIMTNKNKGVLYIGVTNNLERRVWEHKTKHHVGFSSKYYCHRLVYYETHRDVHVAIAREKQLKGWLRKKKIALIQTINPLWHDLSADWYAHGDPSPAKRGQDDRGGRGQDDKNGRRDDNKDGAGQDDKRG